MTRLHAAIIAFVVGVLLTAVAATVVRTAAPVQNAELLTRAITRDECVMISTASAQPPAEYFRGMPNVGRVYYKFCTKGLPVYCFEETPRVWGQVCTMDHDEEAARHLREFVANGRLYQFVSWRCEILNPPMVGNYPMSGKAR